MAKGPRTGSRLVAVLGLLAVLAAACGDGEPADDQEPADDAEEEGLGLENEGQLRVGSDLAFAPFEFIEDNEETGFDIELMDELAGRLDLETDYVDASFDTLLTQLSGGEFDAAIAAITITEERQEAVDFTDPYFEATQALVVPEGSEIADEADVGGQDVGAQAGTTGLDYAKENFTEATITEFDQYPGAFTALEADQIDAVIADLPAADEAVRDRDALTIATEIDTGEQYGIAVQPGNDALREALNGALEEVIDDGTYEELFEEWFPEGDVPERFQGE